ncbi:MAG TPA: hypothetical protein VHH53_11370 [Pseudonocardiaceae bacterium]|nr:hypothetical protein [Pseudonocardiaceae bacterium]
MANLSQSLLPFADAPVDAPPLAGAAAPESGPEPEPAQTTPHFPGVARMVDLAPQPIVSFAGVLAGAAVPAAAPAALDFPGVAGMADLANPLVAA